MSDKMKRAARKGRSARYPGKTLLQTRAPDALARWVDAQAAREGVTRAAWLLRLLLRERGALAGVEGRLKRLESAAGLAGAGNDG